MADIHVINSIRLNNQGLCVLDEDHEWVELHKQQGDLDGACAVYSLVRAMLCKGLLTDDDTRVYNRPDRRSDKGKFLYHFFNERGMVRDGYSYVTLAKEINESSFGITATRKCPKTNKKKIELISEYLYNDTPVIISVVFREGAHAILAVGVESDDNKKITKLLCLDPACRSPRYAHWNCFIDVSKRTKSDYPFYRVNEDLNDKVDLDDILVID